MTRDPVVNHTTTFTHPLGNCLDLLRSRTGARNSHGKKKRRPKAIQSISDSHCSDVSMMSVGDPSHGHSGKLSASSNMVENQSVKSTRKRKCPNTDATTIGATANIRSDKIPHITKQDSKAVKRVRTDIDQFKSADRRGNHKCEKIVPKSRTKTTSNMRLQSIPVNQPNKSVGQSQMESRSDVNRHPSRHRQKSLRRKDPEIWFDDVPPALIAASRSDQSATGKSLIKASSFTGPTRRIGIDCEFVGVGFDGKDNALARVSIVNQFGHVLLDTLVRPEERVVDYRTRFSGIRPEDLRPGGPARPFRAVHKEVAKLCQGRVLVGHSIGNDLKVLMISHPRRSIRDTSKYRPFRALFGGRIPSLRALTERVLGVQVQTGEHDSIEDARAAMRLYTSVKRVWESGKKGRAAKALGFAGIPKPKHAADEQSELTTQLNILSEYESGLDAEAKAERQKPTVLSVKEKAKTIAWDPIRNRRCSKKRSKFLRKRIKRCNRGDFQSAQM